MEQFALARHREKPGFAAAVHHGAERRLSPGRRRCKHIGDRGRYRYLGESTAIRSEPEYRHDRELEIGVVAYHEHPFQRLVRVIFTDGGPEPLHWKLDVTRLG